MDLRNLLEQYLLNSPPDQTQQLLEQAARSPISRAIDTRKFQQYDKSNPVAQQSIGSHAIGVALPNNPYRDVAEMAMLGNVNNGLQNMLGSVKMQGYHGGSPASLGSFRFPTAPESGAFYTSNPRLANIHAKRTQGGQVHSAELEFQNPYIDDYRGTDITRNNAEAAIREAIANGNDGVIIKNFIDMPEDALDVAKRFGVARKYMGDVYIALNPSQISGQRIVPRIEIKNLKGE